MLQAAHAFFESASSLEAEEMGLGQITLGLLPDDPEVQQQGNCLQALQELQDYGLQLLPAAYNQVCALHASLCYLCYPPSLLGNTFRVLFIIPCMCMYDLSGPSRRNLQGDRH